MRSFIFPCHFRSTPPSWRAVISRYNCKRKNAATPSQKLICWLSLFMRDEIRAQNYTCISSFRQRDFANLEGRTDARRTHFQELTHLEIDFSFFLYFYYKTCIYVLAAASRPPPLKCVPQLYQIERSFAEYIVRIV